MLVEDPVFSGDIQECSNSEVQKHQDFGELSRVVSSNQYQPILAMVFVVTDEIEYIILCNYSVIS